MAKKSKQENAELDWLARERHDSDGLDPLGVQVVSINLYSQLVPGLTNVTERVRYCGFYPWIVHRFAKSGQKRGNRESWLKWFRRLDWAYALACIAHERNASSEVLGVTGALAARREFQKQPQLFDIAGGALLRKESKSSYIEAAEGGFGQYKGSLTLLGVLQTPDQARYPDCQITEWAGRPLVECLDENQSFGHLLDIARQGSASSDDLATIGAEIEPAAITSEREMLLFRGLLVGGSDVLCKHQDVIQRTWRGASIRLALSYAQACGVVENDFATEFRWGCASERLQNGRLWEVPDDLDVPRKAWAAYHRNDMLGMALAALLDVALKLLDDATKTPRRLAKQIVDLASPSVVVGEATMVALSGTVSQWIQSCRVDADRFSEDPWSTGSTWELWAALADTPPNDERATAGLAVRLLGRLGSDTGGFEQTGFALFPNGENLANRYAVHLGTWLQRIKERCDTPVLEFLADVILEWVLLRHLRVATRKLANQGISTFHFRPEGGELVRIIERLPEKGLTNPRLRQLHQYLQDLRYLQYGRNGTAITMDGTCLLEDMHRA